MLGETEKSSDVCRTASLSEMGHEQRVTEKTRIRVRVSCICKSDAETAYDHWPPSSVCTVILEILHCTTKAR